jgi:hypothetical protein
MPARLLIALALFGITGCGDRQGSVADSTRKESPVAVDPNFSREDSKCNPSFTPEQCAVAIRSLERDAKKLAEELVAQGPSIAVRKQEEDSQNRALQDVRKRECADQLASLEALRRMQTPSAGDRMTKEELDSLPAEIAKMERNFASNCQ